MAYGLQLHPNLVVPTRFEINFHQAVAVSRFEHLVAEDGFLGIGAL